MLLLVPVSKKCSSLIDLVVFPLLPPLRCSKTANIAPCPSVPFSSLFKNTERIQVLKLPPPPTLFGTLMPQLFTSQVLPLGLYKPVSVIVV
jgi:hypothetical protein